MADRFQLIDAASDDVIIAKLQLATTFWQRFKGLQFRSTLDADEGLLLAPCRSIHTHWMRFSIDVAMLDDNGTVLDLFPAIKPWRIAPRVKGTQSIVETAAGTLTTRLRVGMRTRVAPAASDAGAG